MKRMPARISFDVRLQADGTYAGSNSAVGLLVVASSLDELSRRIQVALETLVARLHQEIGAEATEAYFRGRGIETDTVPHPHSSDIRLELPLSLSA